MSKKGSGLKKFLIAGALLFIISLGFKYFGYIINYREIRKLKNMTVQEVQSYIKTPEQFRFYERYCLDFAVSMDLKSPGRTHKDGGGDCGDKSLFAYFSLEDDGYADNFLAIRLKDTGDSDTFLDIYKNQRLWHMVFYYETDRDRVGGFHKRYCILGDTDLGEYDNLEEIVRAKGGDGYMVLRFNPKGIPDWITTDKDLNVRKAWEPIIQYTPLK